MNTVLGYIIRSRLFVLVCVDIVFTVDTIAYIDWPNELIESLRTEASLQPKVDFPHGVFISKVKFVFRSDELI